MKIRKPRLTVADIAELLDSCADPDGQWDGADVCQDLADFVSAHNGWAECPEHGHYSATKTTCPFDHRGE